MRIPLAGLFALTLTTTPGHAAAPAGGESATTALTLMIGGDLFRHGGVVVAYPIPVPAGTEAVPPGESNPLRLEARYAQVQLRYPAGGHYAFRFRPVDDGSQAVGFRTQLLSLIGTDEQGRGDAVHKGFIGAYTSGGQIIRVLPQKEWGGSDEATGANARWGVTEGYDEPPPADQRSARALISVIGRWRAARAGALRGRCARPGLYGRSRALGRGRGAVVAGHRAGAAWAPL